MFRYRIPSLLPLIMSSLTWKVKTNDKVLYFTFDDGPHPEITPWVLETLEKYQAKATFFCVGENVTRFSETYQAVLSSGHTTGNHTYNHLNGWKTEDNIYFDNIEKCAKAVSSKLFRPPYGRITRRQIKTLQKKGYRIIMWDILTRDYEQGLDTKEAIRACIRTIRKGSVIVLHDSERAKPQLEIILPELLQYFSAKGFTFARL